jgi:hypothetical protein
MDFLRLGPLRREVLMRLTSTLVLGSCIALCACSDGITEPSPNGAAALKNANGNKDAVNGSGTSFASTVSFNVNVKGGPSGENPNGHVTFDFEGTIHSGKPRCLLVAGNLAAVGTLHRDDPNDTVVMVVRDGGDNGVDLVGFISTLSTEPCTQALELAPGLFFSPVEGNVIVTDAQPAVILP